MRIPRVSSFLPEITQQIHSFRASDVMSSHTAWAGLAEAMAFRKSLGNLCGGSVVKILLLVINSYYHKISRTETNIDCGARIIYTIRMLTMLNPNPRATVAQATCGH